MNNETSRVEPMRLAEPFPTLTAAINEIAERAGWDPIAATAIVLGLALTNEPERLLTAIRALDGLGFELRDRHKAALDDKAVDAARAASV